MKIHNRRISALLAALICLGWGAAKPARASLVAARAFAQSMAEDLGLELSPCSKRLLADNTGEEHVCGRTDLPLRKFSAAWDAAAPKRAPRGVKQIGRWGQNRNGGQQQNYEIQGTPLQVAYTPKGKQVTISYSDYSWNVWPCVEGRYDDAGDVFDADNDGEVSGGEMVDKVQPSYPELARVARFQGSVELEALIDEEGQVRDVCVKRPANRALGFEEASIEAVRQWTYKPATRGGVPVKVFLTVSTEFKLH